MFDTPDLSPLCIPPMVAFTVGMFVFMIGSLVERERKTERPQSALIALLITPLVCFATFAISVAFANLNEPRGCDHPPKSDFSQSDLIGTWGGTRETV